jgi:hypothetical protein
MKRILIPALAAVSLATSLGAAAIPTAASAAPWSNINQRQGNIEQRIDMGVRNGSLTRFEAGRLRAEFRNLNVLEARYRRSGGGLTGWERADLNRRYDVLSTQVRFDRHDVQRRF